tara:strand:- start:2955 stop:4079 length:1125 start_codon:yes stop_codon:yes gene_type:complete
MKSISWPDRTNEYWRRASFLEPPQDFKINNNPVEKGWKILPNLDTDISFINGNLLDKNLKEGISVSSIDPKNSLNRPGFIPGGESWNQWTISNGNVYEINVDSRFSSEKPLVIREKIVPSGEVTSNYLFCNIEKNINISIYYLLEGEGKGFHSGGLTVSLNSFSDLKMMQIQNISKETDARFNWEIKNHSKTNSEWNLAALGGKNIRHECRLELEEKESNSTLKGIYIPHNGQRHEFQTQQNHKKGESTSDLLLKGAVGSGSRGIFQGMINIRPDAQKSNAYQTNRNLSLSPAARIETIPGLEIEANDVKCSHGATVSKIDPYSLFYLASRGIEKNEAAKLLAEGFFYEISDSFPKPIRSVINESINKRLLEAF